MTDIPPWVQILSDHGQAKSSFLFYLEKQAADYEQLMESALDGGEYGRAHAMLAVRRAYQAIRRFFLSHEREEQEQDAFLEKTKGA